MRAALLLMATVIAQGALASPVGDPKAGLKPAKYVPPPKAAAVPLPCPTPPPIGDGLKGPVSFRDCADTPEMIVLRGGPFRMGEQGDTGTLYERPVHDVIVSPFSLGRYEVTFDEWDACVADRACRNDVEDDGWGRGRRPVINVTWKDAQAYAEWLSRKTGHRYRLPSEAEWEYASRAGTSTRYSWGDGAEWICASANVLDMSGIAQHPNWDWNAVCDDGQPVTAPVGSYPPNAWGFFDLTGNVWEWTQDCWHPDYTGAPATSAPWIVNGDCDKRVNRGGGWGNHPRSMRSAARDADQLLVHSNGMGFRIARDR